MPSSSSSQTPSRSKRSRRLIPPFSATEDLGSGGGGKVVLSPDQLHRAVYPAWRAPGCRERPARPPAPCRSSCSPGSGEQTATCPGWHWGSGIFPAPQGRERGCDSWGKDGFGQEGCEEGTAPHPRKPGWHLPALQGAKARSRPPLPPASVAGGGHPGLSEPWAVSREDCGTGRSPVTSCSRRRKARHGWEPATAS